MKQITVNNIYAEINSILSTSSGMRTVDVITNVINNLTKKGLANKYLTRQRISGCISAMCCKFMTVKCVDSCLY